VEIDWELYNKRLNINGSTKRERDLNKLQDDITRKSIDSLSYKTIFVKDVERNLIINKGTKSYLKTFQTIPNEKLDLGTAVVWKGKNWLVIESDSDDEVYGIGTLQECNYTLKWQNAKGDILSYPAIFTYSNSVGLDKNNVLTTSSKQFTVQLPFDTETILLREDKRFLCDWQLTQPDAFKITKRNVLTDNYNNSGIINLTLTACERKPDTDIDRVDIMICDYFNPVIQPSTTCQITYKGEPKIFIGGKLKTFESKFFDSQGVEITTPIAQWSANIPDQSKILFKVDSVNPNICTLQVTKDFKLLPEKNPTNNIVRLSLTDTTNTYSTYIDISIQGVM